MARTIDYFFTLQSPWSYLGHLELMRIARSHGVSVAYKPIKLGPIFAATGGLPLPKRHPARQNYRILELQRWIAKRDRPMHLHPRHWPLDPSLADRAVIAVLARDGDGDAVVSRLFSGIFEREENLADESVLASAITEAGFDAAAILSTAKSASCESAYAAATTLAVERGVIGAPTYCLNGEIFWGQDRLPLLEDALTSGRPPYATDA